MTQQVSPSTKERTPNARQQRTASYPLRLRELPESSNGQPTQACSMHTPKSTPNGAHRRFLHVDVVVATALVGCRFDEFHEHTSRRLRVDERDVVPPRAPSRSVVNQRHP